MRTFTRGFCEYALRRVQIGVLPEREGIYHSVAFLRGGTTVSARDPSKPALCSATSCCETLRARLVQCSVGRSDINRRVRRGGCFEACHAAPALRVRFAGRAASAAPVAVASALARLLAQRLLPCEASNAPKDGF